MSIAVHGHLRAYKLTGEATFATRLSETLAECEEMHACEQASVKLMIAYRLHFETGNLHAIEAIQKK
ncbi:MAG: hypothetical protein WAM39_30115 [Bryobacteraceae bacterium]